MIILLGKMPINSSKVRDRFRMKIYMFKTEGCCYLKTFKHSSEGREGGFSTLPIHFERMASEGLKSCPKNLSFGI